MHISQFIKKNKLFNICIKTHFNTVIVFVFSKFVCISLSLLKSQIFLGSFCYPTLTSPCASVWQDSCNRCWRCLRTQNSVCWACAGLSENHYLQFRTGRGIVEVHSFRRVLEQENPNRFSQLFQPTATVIISWWKTVQRCSMLLDWAPSAVSEAGWLIFYELALGE